MLFITIVLRQSGTHPEYKASGRDCKWGFVVMRRRKEENNQMKSVQFSISPSEKIIALDYDKNSK
jgi:hypothetical protein